jgi:hypothetical protein
VIFTEKGATHFWKKKFRKLFPLSLNKIWTKLFIFTTLVVGGAGVERVRERGVRRGGDL